MANAGEGGRCARRNHPFFSGVVRGQNMHFSRKGNDCPPPVRGPVGDKEGMPKVGEEQFNPWCRSGSCCGQYGERGRRKERGVLEDSGCGSRFSPRGPERGEEKPPVVMGRADGSLVQLDLRSRRKKARSQYWAAI